MCTDLLHVSRTWPSTLWVASMLPGVFVLLLPPLSLPSTSVDLHEEGEHPLDPYVLDPKLAQLPASPLQNLTTNLCLLMPLRLARLSVVACLAWSGSGPPSACHILWIPWCRRRCACARFNVKPLNYIGLEVSSVMVTSSYWLAILSKVLHGWGLDATISRRVLENLVNNWDQSHDNNLD